MRIVLQLAASLAAIPAIAQSVAPAPPSARAPSLAQLRARADAYLRASVQHDQFSGTVLIARDGVPIVRAGYGMANYELGVPNTPATVFRIASLTKAFTSMAILQLHASGALNLGDAICQYLTPCPAHWAPITIRQLLTHTSGIPNFSSLPDWDERLGQLPYSPSELVELFRDLPLRFAPGSQFAYSNSGYHLLGLIVERVSRQSFGDYLHQRIFAPIGITHTALIGGQALVPQRATGYYWSGNGFVNAPYLSPRSGFASGGLQSTVDDLLRWDQALYGERLVSRALIDEAFTPVKNSYGYGWEIRSRFDVQLIGHSGSDNGFSTYLMRVPSKRLTVIVLSNSDRTSASKVAVNLTAIALGAPYVLPVAQLYDRLYTTIQRQSATAAVQQYRDLLRTEPDRHDFGEEMLNDLGYDLLTNRRLADAVSIFRLATERFPTSANTFDSLGEGYAALGDTVSAVSAYTKALAIDSTMTSAKRALARLRAP
jgi:CubicO group peptidase (beta-lactamase class C family)